MPELPEVELLKRGLTKYVCGQTISSLVVKTPRLVVGEFRQAIGGTIVQVRRFGKMLSVDLSNGWSIAIHVKMTGRLIYRGEKQPTRLSVDPDLEDLPNVHTHVIFSFRSGDRLFYNDVRKFGWLKFLPTSAIASLPFVAKLGPEPFRNLSFEQFVRLFGKFSRPAKTLLMDQERVAGVGNIYANEALFCARISPLRKANTLRDKEINTLYECILKVLQDGMNYGGSSTDSFRDVLGQKGNYQNHYKVYDREGKRCQRTGCGGTVKKMKLSGRGTYWCPVCQR